MDKKFIINSLKTLIPIVIVLTFLFIFGHEDTDFYYHVNNMGQQLYPPMLSWILNLFGTNQQIRIYALFCLNILMSAAIPYLLILRITKNDLAGWVYLYGTGVPLILFVAWIVPQAMIMVLMLMAVANPWLLSLFILGPFIHEFWLPAFVLTIFYIMLSNEKYQSRLPKIIREAWAYGS